MKSSKKSFLLIGLALSMILGIAFSFVPKKANADIFGGRKVTCWSAGHHTGCDTYITCSNCTDKDGYQHTGPSSKCKPGPNY